MHLVLSSRTVVVGPLSPKGNGDGVVATDDVNHDINQVPRDFAPTAIFTVYPSSYCYFIPTIYEAAAAAADSFRARA